MSSADQLGGTTRLKTRQGLVVGTCGGFVAAAIEIAATSRLLTGPERHLLVLTTIAALVGVGAVLGAALGVFWSLVEWLAPRIRRIGPNRARAFLCAVVAAPSCASLAYALLSGGHMRSLALRPILIPAIALLLSGFVFLGVRSAEGIVARSTSRSRLASVALLGALIVGAAVSYTLDLTVFRRLYGYLHAVLSTVTWALCSLFVLLVFLRFRWVPSRVVALCTLAASIALGLASAATFSRSQNVRYAAFERTATLRNALLLVQAVSGGESSQPRLSRAERRAQYERERRARAAAGRYGSLEGANVVLITVDALRADQLGSYGNRQGLSPNLDRLAAGAVRFDRAYCVAPHSSYSLTSLHTSEYIHEAIELGRDEPRQTIADVLGSRDYRTAAFYTRGIFHTEGERLRTYDERRFGFAVTDHGNRVAELITDRGIEEIDRMVARGEPKFFLWLHYFDTHEPYRSTELGDRPFDRYRAEVRHVDSEIGRLLRHAQRALGRDTVIVLTADHGEEFKEHGGHYHGSTSYDEQTRVPLIVSAPNLRPRVVRNPVELVDVAPTLLRLVGVSPPSSMRGDDLRPLLFDGDDAMPVMPAFISVIHRKTVVRWPYKLIADLRYNVYELYNLELDPSERTNLYDRERATADELRAEIYGWMDELGRPQRVLASAGGEGQGASERIGSEPSEAERAIALGRLADKRAVRPLERLVGDANQRVELRREAARLVGDLAEGSSREVLEQVLGDNDDRLRVEAAASLAKLRSDSGKAVLEQALYSEDTEVRMIASLALGDLGDRRAVPGLIETLSAESLPVRQEAVRLLGALRDTRATETLLELMPEYRTRYLVVVALGMIGDQRAFDALMELLDYEDHTDIRAYAVQALGEVGDSRAVPRLLRVFREEPEIKYTSESLVRLGAIGGGEVTGSDVRADAPELGEGWKRCRHSHRRRVRDYLNATYCETAPGLTASLRLGAALRGASGPVFVTWRARHSGTAGRRASLTVTIGGSRIGPVRLADGWDEFRARLDEVPAGELVARVDVRAEDGGEPIGAAIDHVLIVPAE